MHNSNPQRGAAMFTAIILLIGLTLVALASVGTSLLELRMSGNEETAMAAYQSAEAGSEVATHDAIIDQIYILARGAAGATTCYRTSTKYGWPSSCTYVFPVSAVPAPVNDEYFHFKVTQVSACGPLPASARYASSVKHFSAASFEVESVYDRADQGLGKSAVVAGLIQLIPVAGCGGTPPSGGNFDNN